MDVHEYEAWVVFWAGMQNIVFSMGMGMVDMVTNILDWKTEVSAGQHE